MEHQNNVCNLLKVNNKFNNCSLWTSKSWLGAWVHFNTWRYYEQLIEYNILHIDILSSFLVLNRQLGVCYYGLCFNFEQVFWCIFLLPVGNTLISRLFKVKRQLTILHFMHLRSCKVYDMERRDSIVIKVSSNINEEYSAPHSTFEHRMEALQVEKGPHIQFKVNPSRSSGDRFVGFS